MSRDEMIAGSMVCFWGVLFCFFGNLSWWAEAVEIVVFTIFAFLKGECVAVDRMTGTPGVGVCFCANGEYVMRISNSLGNSGWLLL